MSTTSLDDFETASQIFGEKNDIPRLEKASLQSALALDDILGAYLDAEDDQALQTAKALLLRYVIQIGTLLSSVEGRSLAVPEEAGEQFRPFITSIRSRTECAMALYCGGPDAFTHVTRRELRRKPA